MSLCSQDRVGSRFTASSGYRLGLPMPAKRRRNLRSALSSFSEDKTVGVPRREVAASIKLYDKLK